MSMWGSTTISLRPSSSVSVTVTHFKSNLAEILIWWSSTFHVIVVSIENSSWLEENYISWLDEISIIVFSKSIKVVSSNLGHGGVYSIQQYVMQFVSDLRQVSGLFLVLRFPPPIKLSLNWNIVECGVKHHTPNHSLCKYFIKCLLYVPIFTDKRGLSFGAQPYAIFNTK